MVVRVNLTTIGTSAGPFNIYQNQDGYATALATGIARATLLSPSYYDVNNVNNASTTLRVTSTGGCTNSVFIDITGGGGTTTTTTTSGGGGTTTTTTTPSPQSYFYYNATPCGGGTTIVVKSLINHIFGTVGYDSVGGVCYTLDSYAGGPPSSIDVTETVVDCQAPACLGIPPTTTTTTTSANLEWYQLTDCNTLAVDYSYNYSQGTFSVNDRVTDFQANVYTITNTYSSNPGGSGLFIIATGQTGCPGSGTTTTTTSAPSVNSSILVAVTTEAGADYECLGNLYPTTLATATATLYDQYGNPTNAASNITVAINTDYNPCYNQPQTSTRNILIPAGSSSASITWTASATVDCGQSNCLIETETYNCAFSNTASLPWKSPTVSC